MAVDIGAEAIDRTFDFPSGYTLINKANSASVGGTITSIDIWAVFIDITGLRVGTFYLTNGNTLKCRASEAIADTITVGSKVTKAVSIAVEIGDYIGCYFSGGVIETTFSGGEDLWNESGEYIDPNDETSYSVASEYVMSLGGYIEAAVLVPTGSSPLAQMIQAGLV